MKKWIFFLHNFIEPNHYAIAECIHEMITCGIQYNFVCKRELNNSISKRFCDIKKIKLSELPVAESFWKEYDGIHVIYDGKPALALCALAYTYDIPYIITFHGGYDTNEKIYHQDVVEKNVWLCNHASAVSVVCMEDKYALVKLGVASDKITIIGPSINHSLIMQSVVSSVDKYRITVVGRLIPKKGVEYALRALQRMPQDYKLDVIGDGELAGDLKQLSEDLGLQDRITWHGQLPLEETLRIVAKNLVFWHPSIVAEDGNADGIPQIVLYAMALKRFVVASDASHIGELITSGINGYICRARDVFSFATVTVSNIECSDILGNNASHTVKRFYVDSQKSLYKSIYRISEEL